jgi:lysozyme family protein
MPVSFNFQFVDIPASYSAPKTRVARLPKRIRSKRTLLKSLAQRLQLPGWFGGNWDALEDALRDLSWLPEGEAVAIVHDDLPFGRGESRGIYLAILSSAMNHWRERGDRQFVAVFPGSAQTAMLSDE